MNKCIECKQVKEEVIDIVLRDSVDGEAIEICLDCLADPSHPLWHEQGVRSKDGQLDR